MRFAAEWLVALRARAATAAVAFVALLSAACSSGAAGAGSCGKIAACGGDPTGTWSLVNSCMVPYVRTASAEWCSGLVYDPKEVRDGLFLGHEFLPLSSLTITYGADHNYSALFGWRGRETQYFPPACLKQHGVLAPSCSDLAAAIEDKTQTVLSNVSDVVCDPTTDGGCNCAYTVSVEGAGAQPHVPELGTWRIDRQDSTILNHYPGTSTPAYPADFCVNGDTLELHGHNDTGLITHEALRNLTLTRQPDPAPP
ncbi:MAG TPA: hypothetical protein VNG33_08055 [Polyangiaceae bacterium]|nr:hypothetical protein [Polyangiaceae bacterium]